MKKFITILFLLFALSWHGYAAATHDDGFVRAMELQQYDYCLRLIEKGAPYAQCLAYNEIAWDNYVQLMVHADNVGHLYRDSLVITGINYMSYYGLKNAEKGMYQNAIDLQNVVLVLAGLVYPKDNETSMGAYNQIGGCYYNLGQHEKAVLYADSALSIALNLHVDSVIMTILYDNIGLYSYYATRYIDAKKYLDLAYSYSLSLPNDHNEKLRVLSNLSLLLVQVGQLDKALESVEECLRLAQISNSPYIPTILNNLCDICISTGQYDRAIEYGELGLELLFEQPNVIAQNKNGVSLLMNNMALGYYYLNNPKKGLQFAKEGYRLYQSGDANEEAVLLSNLALLYEKEDIQESVKYYKLALEKVSPKHVLYSFLLNNIALLYWKEDDYINAKLYMEEAIRAIKALGTMSDPRHLSVATMNMSEIYRQLGDNKKAIAYMEEAVKISNSAELNLEQLALLKGNLAFTYTMQSKKPEQAFSAWQESLSSYTELAATQFDFLTEKDRGLYWEKSVPTRRFIPAYVYALFQKHPDYVSLAYDNALQSKGVLLHSSRALTVALSNSSDTMLLSKWNDLKALRQILASPSSILSKYSIDSLSNAAESIETWLMKNSKQYRESQDIWHISWKNVKDKLSDSEVAVEFIRFAPINNTKYAEDNMYAALVLRKNDPYPIMVPLCNEKEVCSLMSRPNETYESENIVPYQLLWSKLCPYIQPGDKVYFSPDGLLYQLNIEAFFTPSGNLLSEEYNLNRLSSTRELVFDRTLPHAHSAVLYGGLNYDVTAEEMIIQSRSYDATSICSYRGDDESRVGFKFLPGTKSEVESIAQSMSQGGICNVTFTANSGNEESFKALSGTNVTILHVATHGFFHSQNEALEKDIYKAKLQNIDDKSIVFIDPLMRSGLMMSGSNLAYQGHWADIPLGVQDGVLYSKEIASIDLSSVDLLVLSACQTGQGDITGDGVFGLQRAFKQAGVNTIIMSLWKVSDSATQLFMTEFYTNWITLKQSKRDAFTHARNSVREKYEEPEYWAGFIMLD